MQKPYNDQTSHHEEVQDLFSSGLGLSDEHSIEGCVVKILADEELRYPFVIATEFLFGCRVEDCPTSEPQLWKLFDGLWQMTNFELIKLIAGNHFWGRGEAPLTIDDQIEFEVYPSEFIVITGPAKERVVQFIDSL